MSRQLHQLISLFLLLGSCVGLDRQERTIPSECCLCDDSGRDGLPSCADPSSCLKHSTRCDYCNTVKTYTAAGWHMQRKCSLEETCRADWVKTASTLACFDSRAHVPLNTRCSFCCKTTDPFDPHKCSRKPDTNYVTFPVPTASTTAAISSTPTTTRAPATTRALSTSTADKGGICEVCLSPDGSCSNAVVRHCHSAEPFCVSKITRGSTGGVEIINKGCATDTECYNEWWMGSHGKAECLEALYSQNASHLTGYCSYCCQSSFGFHTPCNQITWPVNMVSYEKAGSKCFVGFQSYFEVDCPAERPLCRNTFFVAPGRTKIGKSCVAEDSCYHRNQRPECQSTTFTSTVFMDPNDPGFECHFCCKTPKNGTACNTNDLPDHIYQIAPSGPIIG